MRIPRGRGLVMAPRLSTTLRFHAFSSISTIAAHAGNVRFRPTSAYDIDPTIASTPMAFFAEFAAMYTYYRVTAFRAKCNFANLDTTQAALVYMFPINSDPGVNYSVAQAQDYLANPITKSKMLGLGTGSSSGTLNVSTSVARYAGAWDENTFDVYCGLTSGASLPTNNVYVTVGLLSAGNIAVGVTFDTMIDVDIEFFELLNPNA